MSLSQYFVQKCTDIIKENAALILMKLSDPGSLVTFEISGALADAAKAGLGPLASFAGDYLKQNADVVLLETLKATGLEDTAQQAFDLANNILAAALMAQNELIMFFVKHHAQGAISLLRQKQEVLTELSSRTTELYNLLKVFDQGDPIFDPYINQLRTALRSVRSARTDLLLVRNTFVRNNMWLSLRFETAKKSIETAKSLVTPPNKNPSVDRTVAGGQVNKAALSSPVSNPLANGSIGMSDIDNEKAARIATAGLFENPPRPTTDEQKQALIAIPKVSNQVIIAAQSYFAITARINGSIEAFLVAMGSVSTELPAYFKKYILSLFDPLVRRTESLSESMANVLNGAPTAFTNPISGHKVQPLVASVQAFKWGMDLQIILENFKLVPSGGFTKYDDATSIPALGPTSVVGAGGTIPLGPNQFLLVASTINRTPKIGDQVAISRAANPKNNVTKIIAKVDRLTLNDNDDSYRITVRGNFVDWENPTNAQGDFRMPSNPLGSLNLSQEAVLAYQSAVASLRRLDDIRMAGTIFRAHDAQEELGDLESQLLIFLLEANNSLVSANMRKEVLGVAQAVLRRLAITVSRDNQIAGILQAFIDTPLPLEDTLSKIGAGLFNLLADAGLDNALDALQSGDYTRFFTMNSKNATYVGAALAAVALLKSCFPDEANKEKLDKVEFELEKDADLLNIKFSVDFDLAIFKNLQNCLKFKSLGLSYGIQESFCGIIGSSGIGQALGKLKDVLSF